MEKMICLYLLVLSLLDIREQKVPMVLLAGGTAGAVCASGWMVLSSGMQEQSQLQWGLLSAILSIVPGAFMIALAKMTEKVGIGDGWILCNIGLATDYRICIGIWGMSMVGMAFYSGCMLALKKVQGNTKIPYIPFLTAAYVVSTVL